jgi:hypothetical protein
MVGARPADIANGGIYEDDHERRQSYSCGSFANGSSDAIPSINSARQTGSN